MEEKKVTILGNIYGFKGGNYAGTVFDKQGISPCITTCGGVLNARRMLRVLFFQGFTKEQTIMDSME